MGLPLNLLFTAFLILAAAIDGAHADAMITGTVFCDQCKDGRRSLFDYPLFGSSVISTPTFIFLYKNFVSFDKAVRKAQQVAHCSCWSCPTLRLMSRVFDMRIYAVDSLLSQPANPMSFCPKSTTPVPTPGTPSRPPPHWVPPVPRLPQLSPLPPAPPVPFLESSACSHENWTASDYKCYWKAVNPDMKVAVVYGPLAAEKYGTDMTLWEGLAGRGDPYRTLLRETITALLNCDNSLLFPYHTLGVIQHMSLALMGSQQNVLRTALRFRRSNSGSGNITCKSLPASDTSIPIPILIP